MDKKTERLRRARRARGMTLIEIMVVLVILGLIAGAIGYNVFAQLKEAQIKNTQIELRNLSSAIDLYHVETGNWPDSLPQLAPKFIRELKKDAWGSDYGYVRTGDGYDVYSFGPDRAQGGGDDIVMHGGEGGPGATAQQK